MKSSGAPRPAVLQIQLQWAENEKHIIFLCRLMHLDIKVKPLQLWADYTPRDSNVFMSRGSIKTEEILHQQGPVWQWCSPDCSCVLWLKSRGGRVHKGLSCNRLGHVQKKCSLFGTCKAQSLKLQLRRGRSFSYCKNVTFHKKLPFYCHMWNKQNTCG